MKRKLAVLLAAGLISGMLAVPFSAEDETDFVIDLSDVEILSDDEDGMDINLDELLDYEDDGEEYTEDYEDYEEDEYVDSLEEGEEMYWYIVQYHDDGHDSILLNDVVIILPESWNDLYDMVINDDRVDFYHKASRAAYYLEGDTSGGRLFSLCTSADDSYADVLPSYQDLAVSSDGIYYYLEFPTDMQAYPKKDEIREEYEKLYSEIDYVKEESFGLYNLLMDEDLDEDMTEDFLFE